MASPAFSLFLPDHTQKDRTVQRELSLANMIVAVLIGLWQ